MKIIGHRGARGLAPENTLAAIQKALAARVDEIEIDVRLTADGIPILCHDANLLRLTGTNMPIAGNSLADLQRLKPDLCTLESAITLVKRRIPLLIEVKPDVGTAPIIRLLQDFMSRGWQADDFLLASFSQPALLELHQALPAITKVVNEPFLSVRARRRAGQLGTRRLSMNQHFVWFGFVWAMSRSYQLTAYTLNDPNKAARWQKHGLYGCVTDIPDSFAPRRSA